MDEKIKKGKINFSVCIPTFNRAYILERCLDSVLAQTYSPYEIVVIDDGSTDHTKEIVNKYMSKLPIKYYKKENGGKHTALNLGISKSTGDYLIILDSDDWLLPDCLNFFAEKINSIGNKYCAVLARSADQKSNLIGKPFQEDNINMSYLDFHYGKFGGLYGDCCDCFNLKIIKKYHFPDVPETKFIPEAYITDLMGLDYKICCFNNVVLGKEYMNDGITLNAREYTRQNVIGYQINIISKLDDIVPNSTVISLKSKVLLWFQYWEFERQVSKYHVKRITFLGFSVKIVQPILRLVLRYKQNACK